MIMNLGGKNMSCEECPFNKGPKVYGEGTRILREYDVDVPTSDPKVVFKKHIIERDNKGEYDVVVVGMAPAREECNQGRVFVGMSGQILRHTLLQLGIEEYYLCNVFLCPITDDSLVPIAATMCRDVVSEVRSKNPKLVIALGDLPLHTLHPTLRYSIKQCEGRVIPSPVGPLLPITHPAYYIRRPDEFMDFIEFTRVGVRFIEGTYEQGVEPSYTVVDHNNYKDVLNELDKREKMSMDLETSGFIAYGWDTDHILEMGLAVSHDHAYIVPSKFIEEFKELLEKKYIIDWNGQFDCGFLKQRGITPNHQFDGMLAHYTMDERKHSHGLKKVARLYLGVDDWEKDIHDYVKGPNASYENIPIDKRYFYLAKDACYTYQLKPVLEKDYNKKVFEELLMPASRMFIDIEHRGMRVDPVLMMEMEPVITEDMEKIEYELRQATGSWINPNSVPQVKELVYGKMGLPIDSHLGPTTGKEYLGQFADDPVIAGILEYRQLSKMRGAYIMSFAKHTDRKFRIHPKINLFAAVSGRLSSEDPSIMNIKSNSKLKKMFLPDVDSWMGYGDIKGSELRWYCVISGDEDLTRILREGGDPHKEITIEAYGQEYAEDKYLRTQAKAVVFGRIYGRGKRSIEQQVGSDVIDNVMTAVDNIAPSIDNYRKSVEEELKKGYLESWFV